MFMEQFILLLLFPLVGYLCGFFKIAKHDDYRLLTDLAFYVFLPCSVLSSFIGFEFSSSIVNSLVLVFLSLLCISLISFAISRWLKFDNYSTSTFLMCSIFGNIIFLGLPLSEVLFGQSVSQIMNLFIAFHNLFIFGFLFPLIVLSTDKKHNITSSIFRVLKNTVVSFALLGIVFSLLRVDLSGILPYLKSFSSLTTPISMIALGLYFSKNVKIDFSKDVLLFTFSKIVVMPIMTYFVFFGNPYQKQAVFMSMMPVAISNFSIIGSISKKHEKKVLDSIFLSTIISLLLVFLFKIIGFF